VASLLTAAISYLPPLAFPETFFVRSIQYLLGGVDTRCTENPTPLPRIEPRFLGRPATVKCVLVFRVF